MDDETRAAFSRIDRWFELNQAQYNDLRQEIGGLHVKFDGLRQEVGGLRQEVAALRQEVAALREEFHRFRTGSRHSLPRFDSHYSN